MCELHRPHQRTLILAYITVQANYSISQALATDISYANAAFYGCAFASYQDTWYTGRNASTYVVDSIFYGQTDCKCISCYSLSRLFDSSIDLFGFGTAYIAHYLAHGTSIDVLSDGSNQSHSLTGVAMGVLLRGRVLTSRLHLETDMEHTSQTRASFG